MKRKITTAPNTFDMTVNISGPLMVPYDDWPPNVIEAIEEALERKAQEKKMPLKVVYGECKIDYDKAKHAPGRYYLHVIASEVVVADEREIDPERVLSEVPDEIKRLLS